jgi:hypothetical protein
VRNSCAMNVFIVARALLAFSSRSRARAIHTLPPGATIPRPSCAVWRVPGVSPASLVDLMHSTYAVALSQSSQAFNFAGQTAVPRFRRGVAEAADALPPLGCACIGASIPLQDSGVGRTAML